MDLIELLKMIKVIFTSNQWLAWILAFLAIGQSIYSTYVRSKWSKEYKETMEVRLGEKDDHIRKLQDITPPKLLENVKAQAAFYEKDLEETNKRLEAADDELKQKGSENVELQSKIQDLKTQIQEYESKAQESRKVAGDMEDVLARLPGVFETNALSPTSIRIELSGQTGLEKYASAGGLGLMAMMLGGLSKSREEASKTSDQETTHDPETIRKLAKRWEEKKE